MSIFAIIFDGRAMTHHCTAVDRLSDSCSDPKVENNPSHFWIWLDSLKDITSLSFCKHEESDVTIDNRFMNGPVVCNEHSNGRITIKNCKTAIIEQIGNVTISSNTPGKLCYSILPQIDKISGRFKNGTFHGKATLFYHDKTKMKVTFTRGVIDN